MAKTDSLRAATQPSMVKTQKNGSPTLDRAVTTGESSNDGGPSGATTDPGGRPLRASAQEMIASAPAHDQLVLASADNINELFELLRRPHAGYTPGVQRLNARLVRLMPLLRQANNEDLTRQAILVAESLGSTTPNDAFAKDVLDDLDGRLRRSPGLDVLVGLFSFIVLAVPMVLLVLPKVIKFDNVLNINVWTFAALVLAGAVGSAVSVVSRLSEYNSSPTPAWLLRATGFLRPLIGIAFALFLYAIISGDVLAVVAPPGDATASSAFWLAVGFLAGFSERLGGDLVSRAEQLLGSAEAARPAATSRIDSRQQTLGSERA